MKLHRAHPGLRLAVWTLASLALPSQAVDLETARQWMAEARSALAAEEAQVARYWSSRAVNGFLREDPAAGEEREAELLAECASLALRAGATEKARAAHKWVWRFWEERGSDRPNELARARSRYAAILLRLGEHEPARALLEKVLAHTDTLGADHPDRNRAQVLAVLAARAAGDRAGVRQLLERILEERTREFAPDDPEVVQARSGLAQALFDEGDFESAKHLQAQVLEARERTLPELDPARVRARELLATTLLELGDPVAARAHLEAVLAARERTLEAGHPDLVRARQGLAEALRELGDLEGARLQDAAVAEARAEGASGPNADAARALGRLGQTLAQLGRWDEAASALERALESTRGNADHPEVQRAQHWMATLDLVRGAAARAREGYANLAEVLLETDAQVRAGLARAADLAVAVSADPSGGERAAAETLDAAVARAADRLDADDPALALARGRSAVLAGLRGARGRARELATAAVAAVRSRFSPSHPDLLALRRVRAWCELADEDGEGRTRLLSLSGDTRRRLDREWRLDPFAARDRAEWESRELSQLFGWLVHVGAAEEAFELDALVRRLSVERPPLRDAPTHEVARRIETLLRRARRAERVALEDRVLEPGPFASAHRAVARYESELLAVLDSRVAHDAPAVPAIAASLAEGEAAVVVRRHGEGTRGTLRWTALLLTEDGSPVSIELGTDASVRVALEAWMDAVGVGRPGGQPSEAAESERGAALRRLLLDPVLAAAPDTAQLRITTDHGLELVPWASLPLDDEGDGTNGARVGDRYGVRLVPRLGPRPAAEAGERADAARLFVGVGGVDYGARLRVDREASASAPTPPVEGVRFEPLTQSKLEVRELADLVSEFEGSETLLSSAGESTTGWLRTVAPRARALHLATHVFLADETHPAHTDRTFSMPVWIDEPGSAWRGSPAAALTGLAVAGANTGVGAAGRVGGVVTAAEIGRWDLTRCDLVVLSAFQWTTGTERRALGAAALRRAFHGAGVRHVLLPLWPSDPSAARILLEEFYRGFYAASDAAPEVHLHAAQRRLRELGAPPADWAGWQLSSL